MVVSETIKNVYDQFAAVLPSVIIAVLILVFGWAFAILLGRIVMKVLEVIKIDDLADRLGLSQLSERVGKKLSISAFGNWLVKWFFLIVTFIAASDVLGLNQVGQFLFGSVLPYMGNVVIAAAIMVIGIVAANFVREVLTHSLKASRLGNMGSIANLVQWSLLVFAFLAALSQLKVATTFIEDLFTAVVAMFAIAGGIAFGLGGKEHAKAALDRLTSEIKK